MKRIAVCGEVYSTNLGDQAIHACLVHLIKRLDPGVETISLDLSGRAGPPALAQRKAGLRHHIAAWQSRPVLSIAYALANAAYQATHMQRVYAGPWGRQLASAQALVIGGGQLMMDNGLNFPLKVNGAVKQARRLGLPIHFSACGVGRSWSALGHRIFKKALSESASITLRDHLSAQRLNDLLPGIQHRVTFDPAIWASAIYIDVEQVDPAGTIGLGVMSREAFNARTAGSRFSAAGWLDLWLDLLGALRQTNAPVLLFTTGDPADQQFAAALHAQAAARDWQGIELAPQPAAVPQLAHYLRACSIVIAARLHAAVLANAFGIESIGLVWDEKVRAYYEESGRADRCFALSRANHTKIAWAAKELSGQPLPKGLLTVLRERALESARVILSDDFQGEPD